MVIASANVPSLGAVHRAAHWISSVLLINAEVCKRLLIFNLEFRTMQCALNFTVVETYASRPFHLYQCGVCNWIKRFQ